MNECIFIIKEGWNSGKSLWSLLTANFPFLCFWGTFPVAALILLSTLHRVEEGSLVVYISCLENGQVVNSVIVFLAPQHLRGEKETPGNLKTPAGSTQTQNYFHSDKDSFYLSSLLLHFQNIRWGFPEDLRHGILS